MEEAENALETGWERLASEWRRVAIKFNKAATLSEVRMHVRGTVRQEPLQE